MLREGWRNTNSNTATEAYITTKKLLNTIGLDIDELTDAIKESPSITDIYSAYVTLSIDIATELPESILYLFKFFRELAFLSTITKEAYEAGVGAGSFFSWFNPANSFTVNESVFNKQISYSYVDLEIIDGVFGNVGDVEKVRTGSLCILKHQISEVQYEVIEIKNLRSRTIIGGEVPEVTSQILIPLKFDIVQSLNNFDEEKVLLDSIHLCIYAYHEEEIEWYQSSFFKFLLIAGSIFIAVFTGQYELVGLALSGAAAGSYWLLIGLITEILAIVAINYTILWLAEELGLDITAALLIISYVTFTVYTGGLGTGEMAYLPFAEGMLKAASSIIMIEAQEIQLELEELKYESEIFDEELQNRQEELENARDLLGSENYAFDPLFILNIGIYFDPKETPDTFYERTLNFDPGSLTLEAVDVYVEAALTLPKVDQGFENLIGNQIN